ncbi:MAG: IS630 family transposase [Rhodoferax sp.]|nr:IS630 family transposase [Rhodoferax sp.]MCF8208549.1 IS630 family transposase [Rhodoferax sp.]
MITYETWRQIRVLSRRKHMTFAQIAVEMHLNVRTVAKWAILPKYQPRKSAVRASVLDPFKAQVVELLDAHLQSTHRLTAFDIFRRLNKSGYSGGYTPVKEFIRQIRPKSPRGLHEQPLKTQLEANPVAPSEPEKSDAARVYSLRIEHVINPILPTVVDEVSERSVVSFADTLAAIVKLDVEPDWVREFTVLGRHTLEQLSDLIQNVLGWDGRHLYEFRIANRVHAHLIPLESDGLFVDAIGPTISCHIPIKRLGLAIEDRFAYTLHSSNRRMFRITLLEIRPSAINEVVPSLLSCQGKKLTKCGCDGSTLDSDCEIQKPTVVEPDPPRDRLRIRSISNTDASILKEWRASNNKTLWQKAVSILENRNLSIENIASKIEQTEGNVDRWIKAFNRFGLDGLKKPCAHVGVEKLGGIAGRTAVRDVKARRIFEIFHAKPSAYGINRSSWSRKAIALAYSQQHNETISERYAGHLLRQFGYAIRKARKVLTSPDPNYREKVELLLNTLQSLKPGELFFFIDELGPLRVKKYGGRALVKKNETLTYPQVQAHRGVIMMSGALSATSNQVTWIYGRAKDTLAMIDLMELLYNQYHSASKLYVTWDAASWHKSTMLVDWLDTFNATTKLLNEGPLIELVPLPTSSQFLDVIEAVFSGMKTAVVHHSDYRDVPEMKKAISRHFTERNEHFRENPRRAGKKIWEIDFFDDNENIRSGNYREW